MERKGSGRRISGSQEGSQSLLPMAGSDGSSGAPPPTLQAVPVDAAAPMQPMPVANAQPAPAMSVVPAYPPMQGGPPRGPPPPLPKGPAYMPAPGNPGGQQGGFRGPIPNAYQGGAYRSPARQDTESTWKTSGSPVLCNAANGGNFPLERCQVTIDVHMASMFVNMVCSWRVQSNSKTTGLFKLPTAHKATITNCAITIGNRMMRTAVIDANEAGQYAGNSAGASATAATQFPALAECGKYDPACFRMPIPNLHPGELVEMQVSYFETLDYVDGQYIVSVPVAFDGTTLAGRRMESLADIRCKINAGCPSCTLGACTFPYQLQDSSADGPGVVALTCDQTKPWMSNVFEVKYCVGAQDILTNCLNDSASQCFSMVVAPPPADKVTTQWHKHIVFLIDRSGSMHGQPIANAKAALKEAIVTLNEGDFFNIIQFDHEQVWWAPTGPVNATQDNKQQASMWIDSIQARGLTDIMTPLRESITALESMPVNTDAGMCLPFVFLLTDGAVRDEREICHYLAESRRRTRIMTLGIGEYCNHYFLQMMAQMGHGFCEIALQPDKIYQQINHLVQMANTPVLTDVSIEIDGVDECELYPFPIPDLFLGAPIILSGQYRNAVFPAQVTLTGTLATGQQYAVAVPVQPAGNVPVERVFLKQRLEILTSKGWLQDSPEIMQQVVALSTAASMPCAHTTMIAFETTPEQLSKFQQKQGGGSSDELYEVDSRGGPGMAGRKGLSNAAIGALAVGGTIMVVGASAAAFGDLAATLGNVGAFASLGDAFSGIGFGGDIGGGDIGGGDDGCCGCDDDGCCEDCSCDDCCDGCDCTVM